MIRNGAMYIRIVTYYYLLFSLYSSDETAMMFGRHHIYTFDKRYFRFPGFKKSQCQFLVTRDFKDGNFTIMAGSDSISVITRDAVVKIYRNGLVRSQGITKNNKMNMLESSVYDELPVQFENTTVVRDGPYINLTNDFGFSVQCDMEHFICSYIISGFYHNRTAGMYRSNMFFCTSITKKRFLSKHQFEHN